MFEFIQVPGAPAGQNKIRLYRNFSPACQRTMLVVPGFNGYLETYDTLIQMFISLGFNVISFEYRGSGLSDNFTQKFGHHHLTSLTSLREDLETVFACIPLDQQLYMAAVSFGSVTSLHFLADSPLANRIEKLILLAPMIKFLTNKWPQSLARWYGWIGSKLFAETTVYKNYDHGLYDSEKGIFLMYMSFYDPLITKTNALIGCSCPIEIERALKIADYYKDQPNTASILTYKTLNILFQLIDTLPPADSLKIPLLMFTAGKDFYVDTKASIHYGLKNKNCHIVHLPKARHCLILETPENYQIMEQNIKSFLEDTSN